MHMAITLNYSGRVAFSPVCALFDTRPFFKLPMRLGKGGKLCPSASGIAAFLVINSCPSHLGDRTSELIGSLTAQWADVFDDDRLPCCKGGGRPSPPPCMTECFSRHVKRLVTARLRVPSLVHDARRGSLPSHLRATLSASSSGLAVRSLWPRDDRDLRRRAQASRRHPTAEWSLASHITPVARRGATEVW